MQSEQPPGDPPLKTPFEWMGGEDKVRALVDRFYDLMDLEPDYADLRRAHGSELTQARQRLFWFLCGWMGGPEHYTERFGHPRLRMRATCRFQSVCQSATSGLPAWIKPCKRLASTTPCGGA